MPTSVYTQQTGVFVTDLSSTGSITSSSLSNGLGYTRGAAVVQQTSKSTPVTINSRVGTITMNNAALTGVVSFTMNNTSLGATDVLLMYIGGGVAAQIEEYTVSWVVPQAGQATITVHKLDGAASDAVELHFIIFTGAVTA